ncbi:MAG TPA: S1 RNA-binding domain-containing protein, partial [Candidatus Polarisedimenticolaceae bacterium]|nr:S1 RNA-binding domain-containing protein [Candidatus Polarisedimenticolaceae bacterium]
MIEESSRVDPEPDKEVIASVELLETAAPETAPTEAPPPAPDAPGVAEPAPSAEERQRRARNASLFRAYRTHRPLQGRVEKVIKGGYEVRVGKSRGFCPQSQIDLLRAGDPEQYVGQVFAFRIVQIRRGGDDLVLSRRAVLEDERSEEAKAVRATLLEGAVMQGRVAGLAEFGAFVDLGAGVMGLVHVSELGHSRVTRVDRVVKLGDTVRVKVLKLDADTGKVSLSIRQASEDPWQAVGDRFHAGQVCPGRVKRLASFGAFVELEPGVEALAPASEFPPAEGGWCHGLEPEQLRDWRVLSVDPAQRRISLMPDVPGLPAEIAVEPGRQLRGRIQRVESYGVFVWLGPGRVGLMPSALSDTPRGTDLARRFPVGSELEVEVAELGEDGRIRLARPGVLARAKAKAEQPA